ncbi:cysteine-rich receptor-like protein kinase 25 [Rosa rugosa]|uniref:cysteine-rich receptor-like protein kinase 25 n=1 Tax=Rosa rugosa TaxID=74645 RepID=UPI002B403F91|nr:cysteine-rich receptor-like protein kinase 25 [Rosa rugosa]
MFSLPLQRTPILIRFFLWMLCSLSLCTTEAQYYLYHFCPNTTVFTPNSTFQSNRDQLLSSLVSNATLDTGFYRATAGGQISTETVYGLFLCRGDVLKEVCRACVDNAASEVVQSCPVEKEVIIWYDYCMIRYSNRSFLSVASESPGLYMWNTANLTQVGDIRTAQFNQVLSKTMMGVVLEVINATEKFATQEANITGSNITLYTLGQCTQDLSTFDCNRCLRGAVAQLPGCCTGKAGGRVMYPSCNIRFELYRFYTSQALITDDIPPPPAPVATARKGKSKLSSIVIPSILAPVALCVLVVVVARCFIRKLKRAKRQQNQAENDMTTVESLQFDLGTVEAATKNFSADNMLGEGGFGQVFKGTLDNGQEIAVKRLSKSSGQGVREFKNEVLLVAKLQHRNLVKLLGFCLGGEETLLVYEYVPNKSLDFFLFEAKKREQLDWSRRCTIIGGIARGILYLHEDSRLRVIHRDLKASNILLDASMNPKISDFGMARMFGVDDQTQGSTRRIVGTYGYMAPEYAMEGLYSVKSDVFSFGILLLEILTGRKNFLGFHPTTSALTLLSFAWQLWNEGKVLELMDPLLKGSCNPKAFMRYIHIGLLCVQEDANNRPTMSSVVLMLKSESISLSKPERPAFFTGRSINDHRHTLGDLLSCSVNGLTISDDIPR